MPWPGRPVTYETIPVRTIVNRVDNMPFRWSINPYRGCAHRCIYCYARPTHAYLGFEDPAAFDHHILVKEDAVAALRRQLSHPRWRRERIVLGTATDPYQPAEKRFRLTRALLEVLVEFRNPVAITTKSPLVIRDTDLLQELTRVADCTVHISVATLDVDVWRAVEPGAPHPRSRLEALRRLRAAGIPAGILLAPVLPGLTDRNLATVVDAVASCGACFVEPIVLRLPTGVREWCIARLREHHPRLAAAYERYYRNTYAPADYQQRIRRRVARLAQRAGIPTARPQPAPIRQPVQLGLELAPAGP